MNYITQLEIRRDRALEWMMNFAEHLDLDKFKGVDEDGERKDWIATADVIQRLIQLSDILRGELVPMEAV